MFSEKSLRTRFILQLASASMVLIAIVSIMLYYYIRVTILETVVAELTYEAKLIIEKPLELNPKNEYKFKIQLPNKTVTNVEILEYKDKIKKPYFSHYEDELQTFMQLIYNYNDNSYMKLTKETTTQSNIIKQILIDIIIVNATSICLVIFYALFLSRMLLVPIKTLASKLGKLNERFLKEINTNSLPIEFEPLGNVINSLINRIQTFVEYQKELFIGLAHELKTPIAVIKTKNEVTLLKPRENEKYIETLKSNNEIINSMNSMIGSILEIGRQEGAQFEEPVMVDVIGFLNKMGNNLAILARQEKKELILDLNPKILNLKIQQNLLIHIVQNFVQNAIKFSPENSKITLKTQIVDKKFIIEVTDEGIGIDENKDLFAPFKRFGNKSGVGLGLFLAKGAAQALGGTITIKNRQEQNGVIATFTLPIVKNKKGK
ncbi:two-component system sensor histidine kinase [Campylobacter pinnipediorum subsp. pinnipediorum]|nr:two-component system sensor histidine kinase [Campylobacter pinnipediorum subsp. pinnipediorum]